MVKTNNIFVVTRDNDRTALQQSQDFEFDLNKAIFHWKNIKLSIKPKDETIKTLEREKVT